MGCQQASLRKSASLPLPSPKSKIHPLFDSIVPEQCSQTTLKTNPSFLKVQENYRTSANLNEFKIPKAKSQSQQQALKNGKPPVKAVDQKRSIRGVRSHLTVNGRHSQYRVKTSITRVQGPNVATYLDTKAMKIYTLDFDSPVWESQLLMDAQIEDTTESEDKFTIESLLKEIPRLSIIAVNKSTLHFVGSLHLQYNVKTNTFKVLPSMHTPRWNPVLCVGNGSLFSLSGEEETHYSKKCEKFDLTQQEWIELEDIPRPHLKGAALAYQAIVADDDKLKIVVVGGYKTKESLTPTNTASVYDAKRNFWRVIDLQCQNPQTPTLSDIQMVFTSNDELFVFGKTGEETKYYQLEPEENTVTSISNLRLPGDIVSVGFSMESDRTQVVTAQYHGNVELDLEVFESVLPFDKWSRRIL